MNKQNLMPQPSQPVQRSTTGQLPTELAELSEEALSQTADAFSSASVLPSYSLDHERCSYDGDDAE